ncbi:MAG: rhodanese-like domain-containing protein [Planctomycetaceae bacterium]|nr:MAG: rhodanese-like domain-containing protein [Planctomycetaceae bacterium]
MQRLTVLRVSVCFTAMLLVSSAVLAAEHTKDSLDTVKEKLKAKEALLVDVREKGEWDEGHVKNAEFGPLSDLKDADKLEKLLKQLSKDKVLYLHCRSGRRCLNAAEILQKKGYDVRPLKQGYDDLVKAGFEKVNEK